MSDESLLFKPIRELGELVRSRKVSPVELTELSLKRLDGLGRELNAVVTLTADRAMRQAMVAEVEIASGNYRGPLHGIPYGAKDLLATSEGIPTSWGAAPFRDQTFERDATVIRKLEEAGAVLCAKLGMVEIAGGLGYRQPNASFTGPGVNPWNRGHWTGGSSSGSGSAVAAGLVPLAIGSETWGSILGPSCNCGLSGLRPTYGRVSRYGAMALCWTPDKLGPLALTADDCGLVLDAIAGPTRFLLAPKIEGEFTSAQTGDDMGAIGNAAGLPAITVPNGFGPGDLPTGLNLMGNAYDENGVLALARAYQSLTDWHTRHPEGLA